MSIFKRLYTIARAEANARIKTGADGKKWSPRSDPEYTTEGSDYDFKESFEQDSRRSTGQEASRQTSQVDAWYAALEIPPGSDMATVQRAWKSQLRKYHPDMHSADGEKARIAHEVSQQLNQAYQGLKAHLK